MPRYQLIVAYDGTNFHGWQKQVPHAHASVGVPPGAEPVRTVQGVLEEAVRQVVREEVDVIGASRTDAGVHARGQVAAFTTSSAVPRARLPAAINSRLPDDVQVRKAREVDESFNPIGDAVAKGYRYRIAHGCVRGVPRPLFDRFYTTWTAYGLDTAAMNEAARLLIGEHDFASFTRLHHGRESTVRTVHECLVRSTSRHRCVLEIAGDGFLYNMIRIIAGTLIEVGRGRREPGQIAETLAARDRRAAGPTLSPEGLCLMWIRYP